jgi:hypothetical protein
MPGSAASPPIGCWRWRRSSTRRPPKRTSWPRPHGADGPTAGAARLCLVLALPAAVAAQTSGFPDISQRSYATGSAKVTVTGSVKIDEEIPINAPASYSDGEVSWLQYGASGAPEPNLLITYGQGREIGISVGKGRFIATGGIMEGEKSQCSGTVTVQKSSIVGEYTCAGIVSHDPATGLGKVDIKVKFTAGS